MAIQLDETDRGKILAVYISGKLVKADYEHFVPEFERLLRQHGKLRVLFDITGFQGARGCPESAGRPSGRFERS